MTDSRDVYRSTRSPTYPGIERISVPGNPAATTAFAQVDEWLRRRFGSRSPITERAVTWGDLVAKGFAKLTLPDGTPIGVPDDGWVHADPIVVPDNPANDPRVPPRPTGLTVSAAFTINILRWDKPAFTYYGTSEVWAGDTDNLAAAVNVGQTASFIYSHVLGASGITKFYWVRHISKAGRIGPFNAVSGVKGTTGQAGENEISARAITADKMATDSITATNGAIADLAVTRGKIDYLAVDDANIVSLNVGKLLAGQLAVGQHIRSANYNPGVSGFWIGADGNVYLNNVYARGDIHAQSVMGGSYSGYAWPPFGTAGYYLGPGGLLLGNANGGATGYAQITAAGDAYFSNITARGNIEATSLNALSANIVDTVHVRGRAITFPGFSRHTDTYDDIRVDFDWSQPIDGGGGGW